MMPPDQESMIISSITSTTSIPKCNRSESDVDQPVNASISSNNNNHNNAINPCVDDQQSAAAATALRFSILRQSLHPVTLKFEDVSYTVTLRKKSCFSLSSSSHPKPTRAVLNGVSGIVKPGELLAMLGPSGSGKTTLLTALAGKLPGKISGSITYNGNQFSSSMKRNMGFVSQEDILYPHLTVLETLTYTAFLRLPENLSRVQKIEQAELVIMELGLTRCRNSTVGGPLLRGISGGERKRVSIGQELLVNPSLLLLDEPTSGLDSTTAQRIIATVRGLARGGRTVVTTIHQPSSRLYRMFDKVLVLSEGYTIYYGGSHVVMDYLASIGYNPGFNLMMMNNNPADFLLDLANGVNPAETRQDEPPDIQIRPESFDDKAATRQYLISCYKKNLYPAIKDEIQQCLPTPTYSGRLSTTPKSSENQWITSWWLQFNVLLSRGLKERKHESFSGLRIFQVMSVSILSGLLWWHSGIVHLQDQVGLLFFFSIFWGFLPLTNGIMAFPQERPMLIKERSSGMYRLSSYYFARMVGDLPMELVLPTIFITITYWMGGLKPSLLTFLLTLMIVLLNVLVAQGLGLALGAIIMDSKQGSTLASVTMLVFLLAGGYYIRHIPIFISWLKYISFSHYCYKLLIGVQYSKNQVYECRGGGAAAGVRCRVYDDPAIQVLGIDYMGMDVVALILMLLGYRLLAYVALRLGQHH